jgi:hypothetical protein
MLAETRSKVWPMEDMDRVVDERRPQGYPMAPIDLHGEPTEFYGPGFVGPMPGPERHVLPQIMRRSTVQGMIDPQSPVEDDEYARLIRQLWDKATPR